VTAATARGTARSSTGRPPFGREDGEFFFAFVSFFFPPTFSSHSFTSLLSPTQKKCRTDPYGCRWNNGLLIANIVVNSISISGYWSGGCCGCGYFHYYAGNGYGAGVCGYCTFWNGYQVRFFFVFFFIFSDNGKKKKKKKIKPKTEKKKKKLSLSALSPYT